MRKTLTIILTVFIVSFLATARVKANSLYGVPYDTYTMGADGEVPTQTAYLPVGQFGIAAGLKSPQDIFYHDGRFYVADSGNKRVVVFDREGAAEREYGSDEFRLPTGIYCRFDKIYVADKDAQTLFVISETTGEIIRRITKPDSPLFGQSKIPARQSRGRRRREYLYRRRRLDERNHPRHRFRRVCRLCRH